MSTRESKNIKTQTNLATDKLTSPNPAKDLKKYCVQIEQ